MTSTPTGGHAQAGLLLFCGVFGNVRDEDVRTTIGSLPALCAPGATVVWTRGRRSRSDRTAADDGPAAVRSCFAAAGFAELAFSAPDDATFSVGAHRLSVAPAAAATGVGGRLFTFVR